MKSVRMVHIMYALGYLGIAVLTQTTVKWYQYFYTPPDSSGFGLVALIPIGWIGLSMIFARIVDGIADPLVAFWSDKSRHRLGRRVPFILYGAVPLSVIFILIWFPPIQGESVWNFVYLTIMLSLFFIFFTVVAGPYLALIGELSRTTRERNRLTMYQGVAQIIGVMIAEAGSGAIIQGANFQVMGITLGLLSLATILLTPLFVHEDRQAAQDALPQAKFVSSLWLTLSNRNFLFYLIAYLTVWFGINTLTIAMPYITEGLLGKSADVSGYMIAAAFILALLFSPLVPLWSQKAGKRNVLIQASLLFAAVLAATGAFGTLIPFPVAVVITALSGIALAVIFIVPNAMIADVAEADGIERGERREGMFFGAQGLVIKIVIGLSSLFTPFIFSTFGFSIDEPLGLQIVGPVSGGIVLVGAVLLSRYQLTEEQLERLRK